MTINIITIKSLLLPKKLVEELWSMLQGYKEKKFSKKDLPETHTGNQGTKIDLMVQRNILKEQLISKHKIKARMDNNIFKTLM
jgi:hypothetical protein